MGGPGAPGPYRTGPFPSPAGGPWQAGAFGGLRPADWGPRAVARLIDFAIVAIPSALIGALIAAIWVGGQTVLYGGTSNSARNFWIVYSIVGYLLLVGYDAVCLRCWGCTLGKAVMKLRVAVVGGRGHPGEIPVRQVIARAAVFYLVNLFGWVNVIALLLLCVLDLVLFGLWPLWDRPLRQGLHDKIAQTVVLQDS
ncbi:RDD family protein [Marinactinospora rubrisoli]|uniref:RDD family protein n=1 Tax=Marinactinospora rubrisoli TaxID=2715399 RepID=A0ABW2KL18_9ACTN